MPKGYAYPDGKQVMIEQKDDRSVLITVLRADQEPVSVHYTPANMLALAEEIANLEPDAELPLKKARALAFCMLAQDFVRDAGEPLPQPAGEAA